MEVPQDWHIVLTVGTNPLAVNTILEGAKQLFYDRSWHFMLVDHNKMAETTSKVILYKGVLIFFSFPWADCPTLVHSIYLLCKLHHVFCPIHIAISLQKQFQTISSFYTTIHRAFNANKNEVVLYTKRLLLVQVLIKLHPSQFASLLNNNADSKHCQTLLWCTINKRSLVMSLFYHLFPKYVTAKSSQVEWHFQHFKD